MSKKKRNQQCIPTTKYSAPKKTLKTKLQEVYSKTEIDGKLLSLETTCKGSCKCCNVSMPQLNYCEFLQLSNTIWDTASKSEKLDLICKSVEYFFKNDFEKFGMETLIKPCMLLKDGKCSKYASRPLSCRLYGLWPDELYNARVDKFEKAYKDLGLTRNQLPLSKQCPYVKQVNDSVPLTGEVIDTLYKQLDEIDRSVGGYSQLQIDNKENYRTFHDWLLLSIFGEDWLVNLTQFIMAANKETIADQIEALKKALIDKFSKNMPKLKLVK